MNPEIREQWIEALLSGKYQQGKGRLKSITGGEKHCCLGVLCELYVSQVPSAHWRDRHETNGTVGVIVDEKGQQNHILLTDAIKNWAGLPEFIEVALNDKDVEVAWLNDNGATFDEIANLIEASL